MGLAAQSISAIARPDVSVGGATEVAQMSEIRRLVGGWAGRGCLRSLVSEDEDSNVVGLRCAAGELVHGRKQLFEHQVGLDAVHRSHGLEHAVAAKLLVGD